MEAAFSRLHNGGPAAFGRPPTVVDSIMGAGEASYIQKCRQIVYQIFAYSHPAHFPTFPFRRSWSYLISEICSPAPLPNFVRIWSDLLLMPFTKFHGWSPGPIGPFKGNNRGNNGKSTKICNFDEKSDFALYGRWEALVTCKILPRGLGTISTPGKHISEKSFFLVFLTNLASHEI